MDAVFVEDEGFSETLPDYLTDEAYRKLQEHLMKHPGQGDVIEGSGGIRKARWPDPRRGKGKRGGLRILYLHVPEVERFYMLDLYDKDEADDLTPAQVKILARLATEYRRSALRKGKL